MQVAIQVEAAGVALVEKILGANPLIPREFGNGSLCPLLPKMAKIRHEIRHVRHGTV